MDPAPQPSIGHGEQIPSRMSMGVTQLWIGRICVTLLFGIAVMATLGFASSGTQAVGTLSQLLDSENATLVILAKVVEGGLYWAAAIAYVLVSRLGLIVPLLLFTALMVWSVVLDAMTPGFQIRFLKNHVFELVPCILVGALLSCLVWPGKQEPVAP